MVPVVDAGGSEKKLQVASCVDFSREDSGGLRKSSRRSPGRSLSSDLLGDYRVSFTPDSLSWAAKPGPSSQRRHNFL